MTAFVAIGRSAYTPPPDGLWRQSGYYQRFSGRSAFWALGYVRRSRRWLSVEVSYDHLGEARLSAAWKNDAPGPEYGGGTTVSGLAGVAVVARVAWPGRVSPYVALGGWRYKEDFSADLRSGPLRCGLSGVDLVRGVGVMAGHWFVEARWYGTTTLSGSCALNFSHVGALMVGYSF